MIGRLIDMSYLTADQLRSIRQTVDHALDRAAEVTLPLFRQPIEVENKADSGFDPVTLADREAEQVLRNLLTQALPHAAFLGEENSKPEKSPAAVAPIELTKEVQSKLTWVVDPIDGTRAFITGLPLWGTLVALNNGQEVLFGVLDQPWLEERFIGYGDRAERLYKGNSTTLRCRDVRPLNECIVQTTTPDMFADQPSQRGFSQVQEQVSMIRYGGDCYAYALLVMGGIDAVVESGLQPYDIQALIPIVQGAGGVITNWNGEPCLSGGNVVASANPPTHEKLLAALNS